MSNVPHTDVITLRDAHVNDVTIMADIERESFSDPWPASAFRDLMHQAHARLTVALDATGEVCGYCVLLHVLDEGEIANIAVASSRRRRGTAARLLDHALELASEIGARSVYLEVRLSNEPARRLYASRGFEPVGRRRAYYHDPLEDALILRWNVAAA